MLARTIGIIAVIIGCLACAAVLIRITYRQVSPPAAANDDGPELIGGYTLRFALRGPDCYIVDPKGRTVVALAPGQTTRDRGIVLLAVARTYITGEVQDYATARSLGFFLIDTQTGGVQQGLTEEQWRAAWSALKENPPELRPPDTLDL